MPRRDLTPALVLTLGLAAAIPVVPSAGLITTTLAAEGTVTLQSDPAAEAAEREKLFAALAKSANAAEAQGIASQIWTLWFKAPNTDAAALMQQALDRRTAGDYQGSAAALDKLVEAEPDWAEAWNQRATMRYLLNDFDGSLADIDHVLALEPKHFGALVRPGADPHAPGQDGSRASSPAQGGRDRPLPERARPSHAAHGTGYLEREPHTTKACHPAGLQCLRSARHRRARPRLVRMQFRDSHEPGSMTGFVGWLRC